MSGRFALVKSADAMARDFLPPEKRPAAYAYPPKPSARRYRGLGREERDLYDALAPDAPAEAAALVERLEEGEADFSDVLADPAAVRLFAAAFDDADEYELLWLVPAGETPPVPAGFHLLGFDVAYPICTELFSAVSDLFFFPLWHGADPGGRAYKAEFALLNKDGLFPDEKTAQAFLMRYAAGFSEPDLWVTAIYAEEA